MMLNARNLPVILVLQLAVYGKAEDVLVTVSEGTLLGTTATSLYNATYTAFLGVPYAEPPLGELRFAAPRPAPGWEGVRNATQYGSDCIQRDASGSEDCLYLNVYVPGVPEEGAQLPVMFWVYGGGFTRGGGSDREYGPDFLVSYGVILVTMNYRLGAFGFLSTGDEVVPGNAGNKDQQLALSWVQDNIASFGGDPQRVTLFGESAGAMCVSYHLVSPLSAGLFSRVIIQSGNFIGHPNPLQQARWNAFRLGSVLDLETNDTQELVDFLRSLDATDLVVDDSVMLTDEMKVLYYYGIWAPHIEPDLEGAFLIEPSIQTLIDGRFHHVPVMTGVTSGELGYEMANDTEWADILNNQFVESVASCLHLQTAELQREAALKLREFYFGNGTISINDPDPLVNFNNDYMSFEPTDALVKKVSELSDSPVYFYEFDYRGEIVQSTQWGVNHAADIFVLFTRYDTVVNLDPDSEEDQVRRNMVRYWTNFAKYGNPTPEADPVIWEPYDDVTRSYMLMQTSFTLAHNKDAERMDFWQQNIPLQPYAQEINKNL